MVLLSHYLRIIHFLNEIIHNMLRNIYRKVSLNVCILIGLVNKVVSNSRKEKGKLDFSDRLRCCSPAAVANVRKAK